MKKVSLSSPSVFDYFSDISAMKQYLMTKYNKHTGKLKSSDIRKILINDPKIIYKKIIKKSSKQ